jgi:hypothetical protein
VGVRRGEADRCTCGLALKDRVGHAYNEEAFHYLLTIQRERSERSDRPFLLLLVHLEDQARFGGRLEPDVARTLLSSMCRTLRETDVIGWYREGRVAGAVLTDFGNGSRTEASELVVHRLTAVLREQVAPPVADRLQVRVCHIQPKLTS